MYAKQVYFAKCQTTAKPQTTSDQGYETEWLKLQVSLPSILEPSMKPDSHCFLTLITKLQSHLALSGSSVFCKIPLWSIYMCIKSIHKQTKGWWAEASWVSANFRWQVQNTSHRSDHKCRLEYRLPLCNTLWRCTEAAVEMKENKLIPKKMCFEKKKTKKRKKYLGQDSNKDHLNAKSSPSVLWHTTKY